MKSKKNTPARPTWDEYFTGIANLVAERSTCLRRRVGALIVKDKRILSTGYNGTPTGITHCCETGCRREELKVPSGQRHELCRGLHAEQNAVIQAAYHGVSIKDSIIYCTHEPCSVCAKIIINSGIREVRVAGSYPDRLASELFREAEIKVIKVNPPGG